MKYCKIYLTSPEHYLYDELLSYPPEEVDFASRELELSSFKKLNFSQSLNYFIDKVSHNINSHIVLNKKSFDLIQSNGSIIYNTKSPWIVDFEDGTAFTFLQNPTRKENAKVLEVLTSERCKKLLPHCEAAKDSFYNLYDPSENIKDKTEVVYPSFHTPDNYDIDTNKISLLFVAREFERKGGYEVFNAFKQLQEKYSDIEFICVSDVPEDVEKQDCDNARFYSNIERETLYDLYREADIFVYPTFHDTFGLVMLEAMAFGNPVITIEDFATPEIVNDREEGFLLEGYEEKWFDPKTKIRIDKYNDWKILRKQHKEQEKHRITKGIVEKCSILINDEKKRAKFSDNAREKIKTGKFSIEKRNQKLKSIYKNAIE